MKCEKCGFENVSGADFCGNCGFKQTAVPQPIPPKQNKNNKKKIIILVSVLVAVALLITILVLIFNKTGKFNDPFESVDDLVANKQTYSTREYEDVKSVSKTLEQEYKENKISADKYMMQLAYSIYDTDKLDYKYKDMDLGTPNPTELFKKAGELADSLSIETAKYIVDKYLLTDVEWNVELDTNASGMSNNQNNDYKVVPLVSEESDLSKLDKAVLSSNKHFIVYYTTSGSNAITTEEANKIAKNLESVASAYEKKYGLKFQYNPNLQEGVFGTITEVLTFGGVPQATSKAQKVLKNSNIDTKYMDTAMPVFIIDTDAENTNALGYYVHDSSVFNGFTKLVIRVFGEENAQYDSILTTYAFPYFVVSSSLDSFDDTKIVLAHELFHHYQAYICGDGTYGECTSGLFTSETTANFAAVENLDVNKYGTALNNHAIWYMSDVSSSIDKVGEKYKGENAGGYGAFAFANNYDEVVTNGANHLFQSMKYENPLKYLSDNSGGNYKKALLLTAERNLTLDYDNKLYLAQSDEKLYYPENYKDLGVTDNNLDFNIDYSSMQYFYINPNKYTNEKSQITFNGNNNDLSLLLFVKEDGNYKLLYTHTLKKEFVVNVSDFELYDEVVFGIVNSSVSANANYNVEVKQNGTKTPTVTADSLKLNTLENAVKNNSSFMCHQIDEDDEWYNVYQIKVGFDNNSKLNEMYFKGTYKIKNYKENDIAFNITKKIVSGLLYTMEASYKEQFKYVKTIINEKDDEYSVTFKITKDFYDALNGSFSISGDTKFEIIKSIRSEGFVCNFE